MDSTLAQPINLKCGLVLKNRLVKAAMAECMADNGGLPSVKHNNVYREWGNGGWGMIITGTTPSTTISTLANTYSIGNVQVDSMYLGDARDITVDPGRETELLEKWSIWAKASTANGTPTIMQINHPGRQSPLGAGSRSFCAQNIAPSAVPLDLGSGLVARFASSCIFGTPREMTPQDIERVMKRFVDCSRLALKAGFQGVEIHAAHGYLLAQFLSSKTNRRKDKYGGSAEGRARIVVEIIEAIRRALPADFCVGIKVNSADHQSQEALSDFVVQLKMIVEAGVDFVEISGGSYEDPKMMQASTQIQKEKPSRTNAREAFFLEFASAIRHEFPAVPLMVTGGFRTRDGMARAIESNACDMVGLGRPAVLEPSLPRSIILNNEVSDEMAHVMTSPVPTPWFIKMAGVKSAGSGAETVS
ncbi:hypothetical protein ZTR_02976 [Talaromyces verruculosus]|nr:hypothetical protein ZTR_02976 [Talaromyces verruculosus]